MAVLPIGAAVRLLAEKDPNRPAITEVPVPGVDIPERTITRLELEKRTNRLARTYERLGVTEGSFVTVGIANSIDFYEASIAAWKLGATPQPISHRLPERERNEIIELARPSLVVIDPETARGFNASVDGVQLVPGPLYHNAPFMFSVAALFTGNHIIVMPRFDAQRALELIAEYQVDWTLLVPTMMLRMHRLPEEVKRKYPLDSLKGILHLAAPCPPWLKEAWIEWIGADKVWELYAGTEAQGVTIIGGEEWMAHRGTVGKATPGRMKIVDPGTGEECPPGEIGELWMKPPEGASTYTYIGAEARTDDEGWESLGDMGYIDADGYLYLADRRTDMILAGGANIYPAEVEAALDEHPAIRSCAVIGLPDEDLGQRVHAVIEIDDSAGEVTDDELRAFLKERLVSYKIPRAFERVEGQVRDDAGKVRRSGLRAERMGSSQ